MKFNKKNLFSILLFGSIFILMVILAISLVPLLIEVIKNVKDESNMISYIDAYGIRGIPVIVGLQILQVVSAILPAAPIQVLAGLCYGIWVGALICILGCILGNTIVFTALRHFRKALEPLFKKDEPTDKIKKKIKFFDLDKISKYKHLELVAFVLYLMPVVPNGMLTYILSQTKITFPKYLLSMAMASIPSVLICSWIGERLSKGDYKTALIILAAVSVIIILVITFRNKIMTKLEQSAEN